LLFFYQPLQRSFSGKKGFFKTNGRLSQRGC
jgi:hypothetical protein